MSNTLACQTAFVLCRRVPKAFFCIELEKQRSGESRLIHFNFVEPASKPDRNIDGAFHLLILNGLAIVSPCRN